MIIDGAPPSYHACIFICFSISSFVAVKGKPNTLSVIYGDTRVGEIFIADNDAYAVFVFVIVSKCNVNFV